MRNAQQVYKEHSALIRGAAPADRFLEYDVSSGWKPLCEFLDVPQPKEEFPSGNVAEEFRVKAMEGFNPRIQRSLRNMGSIVVLIGAVSFGVWRYGLPHVWT